MTISSCQSQVLNPSHAKVRAEFCAFLRSQQESSHGYLCFKLDLRLQLVSDIESVKIMKDQICLSKNKPDLIHNIHRRSFHR